jgi:hypothetical protein
MFKEGADRMEDVKSWMLIASIMGTASGIYVSSAINPPNNYVMFMVIFALVGIILANLVLLLLVELDRWQKGFARGGGETSESSQVNL